MRRELVTGGVAGGVWAAGLRAWMVTLVGDESTFTWRGTVGFLVLPSVVVGGAIGSAVGMRKRSDARYRRALIGAPGILALAPLVMPGAVQRLVQTGQGSGAMGMVSLGMLGAAGLSGRGRWRAAAKVVGLAPAVAIWLAPPMRPEIAPSKALGFVSDASFSFLYLVMVYAFSLLLRPAEKGVHSVERSKPQGEIVST